MQIKLYCLVCQSHGIEQEVEDKGENTKCPQCGEREYFRAKVMEVI